MEINVNRKSVFWGYLSQFISMGSGMIVLPFVLRLLSTEEIGFNYLLLTIGSFVTLLDFGFAPQFGRNVTYVFMGVRVLKKEGVEESQKDVNYHLLATLIESAKYIYRLLSGIALLLVSTLGTWYVYKITNGFELINNVLVIWLLYCGSVFFNLYYLYYASLLNGSGKIIEYRKALTYSKIVYTVLSITLLLLGLGLLSVVLANLIAPFVSRFICHKSFFTKALREKINGFIISKKERNKVISIIWYNSKKLGLVFTGNCIISKASFFIAGLFLSLDDIASYGLMVQIFSFIASCSLTIHYLYHPRITSLWVSKDKKLIPEFSSTIVIFILLFSTFSILFCVFGSDILALISSNVNLPSVYILVIYSAVMFFDSNQAIFTAFISINNEIPFLRSTLISGVFIVLLSYICLNSFSAGILALVLVQGSVQLAYNNWKWVHYSLRMLNTSYFAILKFGCRDVKNKLIRL